MSTNKPLEVKVENLGTLFAVPKQFKTGSDGYFAGGKLVNADGTRFQVSMSIVRIGSKVS